LLWVIEETSLTADNTEEDVAGLKFGTKVPYYLRVSELKKRLLVHVLSCPEKICNSNHIATALRYDPSSVRQAVEELEEEHYIQREQWKGRTKKIILTTKGACAATVHTKTINGTYSGICKQLEKYTKDHFPSGLAAFEGLNRRIRGPEQKDYLTYVAMECMLENDWFDELGKELIPEGQLHRAERRIAEAGLSKFGRVEVGSKEYYERYSISREFTNDMINQYQKRLDDVRDRVQRNSVDNIG
jgi:DNA-binding MarR family transcriptional regulator